MKEFVKHATPDFSQGTGLFPSDCRMKNSSHSGLNVRSAQNIIFGVRRIFGTRVCATRRRRQASVLRGRSSHLGAFLPVRSRRPRLLFERAFHQVLPGLLQLSFPHPTERTCGPGPGSWTRASSCVALGRTRHHGAVTARHGCLPCPVWFPVSNVLHPFSTHQCHMYSHGHTPTHAHSGTCTRRRTQCSHITCMCRHPHPHWDLWAPH